MAWVTTAIVLCGCHATPAYVSDSALPADTRYTYPSHNGSCVVDLDDVLSEDIESRLVRKLSKVRERTGVSIVVASVGTYASTQKYSIEDFATGLFDKWGVGRQPENDGILLLLAKQDWKARIELGAFYSRRYDAEAQRVMDEVLVPLFRVGKYVDGLQRGADELTRRFAERAKQ